MNSARLRSARGHRSDAVAIVEILETRIAPAFGAVFELSALGGANGFQMNGEAAGHYAGRSVSAAGDINGDGFDDLIVGANYANPNGGASGASYVVFGRDTAAGGNFAANLELSSLDGMNGFKISGEVAGDNSGISVSAAGDINGDGFDDLIIGAHFANPNGAHSGAAYVVFGKDTAMSGNFPANLQLSALDGTNGFQINGEAANDQLGRVVSRAGDVNGDGFDDVIVGAPGASPNGAASGASYVIFGKKTSVSGNFPGTLELSTLDGINGFQINGEVAGDVAGVVAAAGDINHDGVDDVLIGARLADPNGGGSGATYVVFGKDTAMSGNFAATLELSALTGANGFQINGEAGGDSSGFSVRGAGDINADGFDDLVIGAETNDGSGADAGAAYVVFGKDTAASGNFGATLNLSALDGNNGFKLSGAAAGDRAGRSVSGVGDINGDGFDDLLVGAFLASSGTTYSGSSFLIFGRPGGFGANLNLADLNGRTGFRINGEAASDYAGDQVSGAGDINGDGLNDLLIGALFADPNGNFSGAGYVVFGQPGGGPLAGEAVISTNGKSATFTDADGDLVTVTTTRGTFTQGNFTLRLADPSEDAAQLQMLTLDATFTGANITITAKPGPAGGNGFVNVGAINATGVDLGMVKLPGDLGQIDAGTAGGDPKVPGIKSLTVQSLGLLGVSTQAAGGDLESIVLGGIKSFTVLADVGGADFFTDGDIAALKIGGSLVGGASADAGRISATTLGAVTVGGNLIGGDGDDSGQIFANGDIRGPVKIGGSILGGGGERSGALRNRGDFGAVTVGHDVRGGAGIASGIISAEDSIKSLKIGGSLVGGAGDFSGKVDTDEAGIGAVTIGGNIEAGTGARSGLRSGGALASVKVGGEVFGNGSIFAVISARDSIPGGVSIGGSVRNAEIKAGFNEGGFASASDVQIGKVSVKGDWIFSSITAGVSAGADERFGTADDVVIPGGVASVLSSIKSITIGGEARAGDDPAAFTAEQIGSLKIGGTAFPLTKGAVEDDILIGPTFDFRARELDAVAPAAPVVPAPFTAPAPAISTDGRTVTFNDVDGDTVTVKTDKGRFDLGANFTFAAGPFGGFQLQTIDVSGDADFIGRKASITVTAKRSTLGGDGWVDVGYVNATGVDLVNVSIDGDLGQIDAGDSDTATQALAKVSVHSLGGRGTDTQALPANLSSDIAGRVGSLQVATDILAGFIVTGGAADANGSIGTVKIGGSIIGSGMQPAHVSATGDITKAGIGRDIRGSGSAENGRLFAGGMLGSVSVGGSLIGGSGEDTGTIEGGEGIGKTSIKGGLIGGDGDGSAALATDGDLGPVTIGRNLIGGAGFESATIDAGGRLVAVTIGGSAISGAGGFSASIQAQLDVLSVTIKGGVFGSAASPVIISGGAPKVVQSPPKADPTIGKVAIGGSAHFLLVQAGYDETNLTTGSALIGSVSVGGDFFASSIAASIGAGVSGFFGDGDDTIAAQIGGVPSRIASIIVKGHATGTGTAGDSFGIVAEQIDKAQFGKVKLKLDPGPNDPTDAFALAPTGPGATGLSSDFFLRELTA